MAISKKHHKKAAKKAAPKKKLAKKAAKKSAEKVITPKKAAKKYAIKKGYSLARNPNSVKKDNFEPENKKIVYANALIKNATFIKNNVLSITFTDNHVQEVDFSPFLDKESTPTYLKEYKEERKFKKFKIQDGNLVWGKDWDLVFPISQLYKGEIK
jgi:Protein of unknown function (DUF2442)